MILALSVILAPGAVQAANPDQILGHKQQQVRQLEQLVDSAGQATRRGQMLFELARLQLEVAILGERNGRPDLGPPIVTCRRLIAEQPGFSGAAEVRLMLARLELRRSRPRDALLVLAEVEQRGAPQRLLCEGRMLAGACHLESAQPSDRGKAQELFSALVSSEGCPAALRSQARYRLAWILLGDRCTPRSAHVAAFHLRQLCQQAHVERGLQQRALQDLVLAWSMGVPDADASRFLLDRGRGDLLSGLARKLMEAGKLKELMALRLPPDGVAAAELRRLRVQAAARLGTVEQLEQELKAAWPRGDRGQSGDVGREALAQDVLDRAARADTPPADARRLLARLIETRAHTKVGGRARLRLAELLVQGGDLVAAAGQLEVLAGDARPEVAATAAHQLVRCREQLLQATDASQRPQRLASFIRAAKAFIRRHPRDPRTPEIQLVLGSHLALTADNEAVVLLRDYVDHQPPHPRRQLALDLLLAALARAAEHEEVYRRVSQEAVPPLLHRRAAAAAAQARCRMLTSQQRWSEAQQWATRALQVDPAADATLQRRTRVVAATLAARAGRPEEGLALLRQLRSETTGSAHREVLQALALHQESAGQLKAAATTHLELAEVSGRLTDQLDRLEQAALAAALDGDTALARDSARRLRRALAGKDVPSRLVGPWQLRVGRVLERMSGAAVAYRHYLRQAHALWRHDGPSAARCLLRAAELASTARGAVRLFEQAQTQAGALRRRGRLDPVAVGARVGLARAVRTRLAPRLKPEPQLVALQTQQEALLPLLSVDDPRWASAAALELARIQAGMASALSQADPPAGLSTADGRRYAAAVAARVAALTDLRQRLLRRLAGAPGGPNRFSLAAAGELEGRADAPIALGAVPTASIARPVAALLETRRYRAARRVASQALQVHGPNADLLCGRAMARLALNQVHDAVSDLRQALALDPRPARCAREQLDLVTAGYPSREERR